MKKVLVFLLLLTFGLSAASVAMAGCANHPDAYENYHPTTEYQDWSAEHHKVLWDDTVFCSECGEVISNDWGEDLESHNFVNGTCWCCGHVESNGPSYEELQAAAQKRVTEDGENIPGKTAIIIHNGNLRAAASKDSADLGAVISGDEYEIVSYQISADNTVWLEIKYLDGTAWVSASLAKISGDTALYDYAEFYVNRTCRIKVSSGRGRIAPGTKNPIVAYVRYNEKYTILDCQPAADDTLWFKIKVDRTECWISSSLAELY